MTPEKRRWALGDAKRACRMIAEGATYDQVAAAFPGRSRAAVRYVLRRERRDPEAGSQAPAYVGSPRPRVDWWGADHDRRLVEGRAMGRTFREMAPEFGVSESYLSTRARRLLADSLTDPAPTPAASPEGPAGPPPHDPMEGRSPEEGRHGLGPGHPVSWGIICAGTTLEGIPYPRGR